MVVGDSNFSIDINLFGEIHKFSLKKLLRQEDCKHGADKSWLTTTVITLCGAVLGTESRSLSNVEWVFLSEQAELLWQKWSQVYKPLTPLMTCCQGFLFGPGPESREHGVRNRSLMRTTSCSPSLHFLCLTQESTAAMAPLSSARLFCSRNANTHIVSCAVY